jgi:hypothetical protein
VDYEMSFAGDKKTRKRENPQSNPLKNVFSPPATCLSFPRPPIIISTASTPLSANPSVYQNNQVAHNLISTGRLKENPKTGFQQIFVGKNLLKTKRKRLGENNNNWLEMR